MAEEHQPALPNMGWIQQTWDGLLVITTSPVMDITGALPRSIPIVGVILTVGRGIVSGVLQYSGDPKKDAAAE